MPPAAKNAAALLQELLGSSRSRRQAGITGKDLWEICTPASHSRGTTRSPEMICKDEEPPPLWGSAPGHSWGITGLSSSHVQSERPKLHPVAAASFFSHRLLSSEEFHSIAFGNAVPAAAGSSPCSLCSGPNEPPVFPRVPSIRQPCTGPTPLLNSHQNFHFHFKQHFRENNWPETRPHDGRFRQDNVIKG